MNPKMPIFGHSALRFQQLGALAWKPCTFSRFQGYLADRIIMPKTLVFCTEKSKSTSQNQNVPIDHLSRKNGPNFFIENVARDSLKSLFFGPKAAPFCCKNANLPNRACFTRILPWRHGRPRLRVMDVCTKMLIFPGFRGLDRSFCPRTSTGISAWTSAGYPDPKVTLWAAFWFLNPRSALVGIAMEAIADSSGSSPESEDSPLKPLRLEACPTTY